MKKTHPCTHNETPSYQTPNFILIDKRIPYLFKKACQKVFNQNALIDTASLNEEFILIDNQTGEIIK